MTRQKEQQNHVLLANTDSNYDYFRLDKMWILPPNRASKHFHYINSTSKFTRTVWPGKMLKKLNNIIVF